ncbi:hypothetical protein ACHFJ0_05125 [Paracoccus sp. NGMCC 1.201697]|uniref:Uncharacterized protein n=1 Tax=Paracoccus broussonetiae subsp. drimophilus TaxID=3373869 RepID=A0ABW7LH05_9RHOB
MENEVERLKMVVREMEQTQIRLYERVDYLLEMSRIKQAHSAWQYPSARDWFLSIVVAAASSALASAIILAVKH